MDSGRTVNYTYDALARLKTAVTLGSATYAQWGLSWSYDRYGNRNQTVTVPDGKVGGTSLSFSATTNRINSAGSGYDAAGNLTSYDMLSYGYDAENRLDNLTSGAATYLYDADGLREKKLVGS